MKINCIIVDDEPLAREGLKDYVRDIDFLTLKGEFRNALEANSFLNREVVDLIFLDINMPKMTGLEWLRNMKAPPLVIFTTAYREFAVDSYELEGFDYLVKPVSFERFLKAVNKAFDHLTAKPDEEQQHFFVKVDGKITKVNLAAVDHIEGMKDYIRICLDDGSVLITLISLKQIEKQLPPGRFIRVHRSFIIATDKVSSIEGNVIRMGTREIPIASSLRPGVIDRIVGDKFWKRA